MRRRCRRTGDSKQYGIGENIARVVARGPLLSWSLLDYLGLSHVMGMVRGSTGCVGVETVGDRAGRLQSEVQPATSTRGADGACCPSFRTARQPGSPVSTPMALPHPSESATHVADRAARLLPRGFVDRRAARSLARNPPWWSSASLRLHSLAEEVRAARQHIVGIVTALGCDQSIPLRPIVPLPIPMVEPYRADRVVRAVQR